MLAVSQGLFLSMSHGITPRLSRDQVHGSVCAAVGGGAQAFLPVGSPASLKSNSVATYCMHIFLLPFTPHEISRGKEALVADVNPWDERGPLEVWDLHANRCRAIARPGTCHEPITHRAFVS